MWISIDCPSIHHKNATGHFAAVVLEVVARQALSAAEFEEILSRNPSIYRSQYDSGIEVMESSKGCGLAGRMICRLINPNLKRGLA
jgi:Rod binding domain-containing protein